MNILGTLLPVPVCYYLFCQDQKKRNPSPLHHQALSFQKAFFLFLFGAAVAIYGNIIVASLPFTASSNEYNESMNLITQNHSLFFLLFWSSLCAPISEELVFRWLIYKRLRDYTSLRFSVLLSAFLFGLYHGNLVQFVYAFFIGILLALVIEWTGNLWSCILLHISANLCVSLHPFFIDRVLSYKWGVGIYSLTMIALFILLFISPWHIKKKSR